MWEYYVIGVFFTIIIICCCCVKVHVNALDFDEFSELPLAPAEESVTVLTEDSQIQRREERGFLILTNLIHKKVVSNVLPHEIELSARSAPKVDEDEHENDKEDTDESNDDDRSNKIDNNSNGDSVELGDNNFDIDMESNNITKDNIMLEPLKSFRSSRRINRQESATSFYSSKDCPICLEQYQENDEICWSKNEKCCHAYHLSCMIDWLMDHDDCPLCRADYLML